MKKIFIVFYFFSLNSEAHAYLDPGTGSIIIQAILGAFAVFFTTASIYWEKLKNLFKKFFKKNKKN